MISIFLFYNVSNGIHAPLSFSKIYRHTNIITFDGDAWTNYELDSTGIHTRHLQVKNAESLIRGLKHIKELTALIIVETDKPHRHRWFPWWVRSCNEFDRYISGVDIGFTFNPTHLMRKLIRYDKQRNYTILTHWRRQDGILGRS